jgi:hypothetical protein
MAAQITQPPMRPRARSAVSPPHVPRGAAWCPVALRAPPSSFKRGISLRDDGLLRRMARAAQWFVLVRDSNPEAMRWIGDPRAVPKPASLKLKTLRSGPSAGLACASAATPEEVSQILTAGFFIHAKTRNVTDCNGKLLHADVDVHGIYDMEGRDAWNDTLLGALFQHPPHDNWRDRNDPIKAGANFGPQPPVTVYLPDGSRQWLQSVRDMRAFYLENGLPWKRLYPLPLRRYRR